MTLTQDVVRSGWNCVRFTSPFDGFFGSAVEADDDVLGVAWDVDPVRADLRALGEAVERAALHEPPAATPTWISAAELGPRGIRLSDRATFSLAQVSSDPELRAFAWDEHVANSWIPMQSPGGPLMVPVDVERMRIQDSDAVRPKPMTSIGAACGTDWDATLGRAMTEIVERHVVACAVYTGRRAVRLHSQDDLYSVRDISEIFGDDAEVVVGLIPGTNFGMQVALAAVVGRRDGLPEVAFGSASSLDAAEAIRSAAIEAVHIFHLGWRLLRRGSDPDSTPTSINSRALWWARHGLKHVGRYFEDGVVAGPKRSISDRNVSAVIGNALTEHGHQWAYSDISPSWAQGIVVARAVVPSLLHLQVNQFPFHVAPRFTAEIESFRGRSDAGDVTHHPFV